MPWFENTTFFVNLSFIVNFIVIFFTGFFYSKNKTKDDLLLHKSLFGVGFVAFAILCGLYSKAYNFYAVAAMMLNYFSIVAFALIFFKNAAIRGSENKTPPKK